MTLRCASLLSALALGAGAATAAPHSGGSDPHETAPADGIYRTAAACGWYAIYTCDRTPNVGGPGYTVSTDDYPNFRKGWYCNIGGPFNSKADAKAAARRFGGYAKRAC